jgi:hypothetical protein
MLLRTWFKQPGAYAGLLAASLAPATCLADDLPGIAQPVEEARPQPAGTRYPVKMRSAQDRWQRLKDVYGTPSVSSTEPVQASSPSESAAAPPAVVSSASTETDAVVAREAGKTSLSEIETSSPARAEATPAWARAPETAGPTATTVSTEETILAANGASEESRALPIPVPVKESVESFGLNPVELVPAEPAWILPVETSDDSVTVDKTPREEIPAPSDVVDESAATVPSGSADLNAVPLEAVGQNQPRVAFLQPDATPMPGRSDNKLTLDIRRIDQIVPESTRLNDTEIREYALRKSGLVVGSDGNKIDVFQETYVEREFVPTVFQWEAPNQTYYTPYFEDIVAERYGQTYPFVVQPFVSAARFGGRLVTMPYQMALDPPWVERYSLGYYRPGEVTPKLTYQIPWNAKAAAVQAGTVTGLFFAIP